MSRPSGSRSFMKSAQCPRHSGLRTDWRSRRARRRGVQRLDRHRDRLHGNISSTISRRLRMRTSIIAAVSGRELRRAAPKVRVSPCRAQQAPPRSGLAATNACATAAPAASAASISALHASGGTKRVTGRAPRSLSGKIACTPAAAQFRRDPADRRRWRLLSPPRRRKRRQPRGSSPRRRSPNEKLRPGAPGRGDAADAGFNQGAREQDPAGRAGR